MLEEEPELLGSRGRQHLAPTSFVAGFAIAVVLFDWSVAEPLLLRLRLRLLRLLGVAEKLSLVATARVLERGF